MIDPALRKIGATTPPFTNIASLPGDSPRSVKSPQEARIGDNHSRNDTPGRITKRDEFAGAVCVSFHDQLNSAGER